MELLELLFGLLEFLVEPLLQVLFEVLIDLGLHRFRRGARRTPPRALVAALAYAVLGVLVGLLSLLLFPSLAIREAWAQRLNLLVTPLLAGSFMAWLGSWRQRHGRERIRIERFTYGALFALTMALTRLVAAG